MERHLSDFHRSKSHTQFLNLNNKLIEVIEKKNLRDIDTIVNEDYFKVNYCNKKANKKQFKEQ